MATIKRRWLKIVGIILGILAIAGIIFLLVAHEPRPEGTPGAPAEALAHRMQTAINIAAWDSSQAVRWSFAGQHDFVWDKDRHWASVRWGKYHALVRLDSIDGRVWKGDQEITNDKQRRKLIRRANFLWMNDSFWLNAPAKAFDAGTERSIVVQDGDTALLVTYTSGGATPGDAYLWLLDEQDRPKAWKMWVKIIPVGGLRFDWTDWQTTQTGALLAGKRRGLATLSLDGIETGTLQQLNAETLFVPLEELP